MEQAGALFAEAPFRWWISGGHALELHIGESWRSREDLDGGEDPEASGGHAARGWIRIEVQPPAHDADVISHAGIAGHVALRHPVAMEGLPVAA